MELVGQLAGTGNLAQMIGVFGASLYITGYFLLQLGFIRGNGYLYPTLQIFAASSVLFSLTHDFNLAGAIIQLAFVTISLMGITRMYASTHLIRFAPFEQEFIQNYLIEIRPLQARRLLNTATLRRFELGDSIVQQGVPVKHLVYILSGQTDVTVNGHAIASCGDHQILGELTFGTGLPATASVYAAEPTTCLVFDGPRLTQLMRRNPEIRSSLMAAHFRSTRAKLVHSNNKVIATYQNRQESAAA